VGLIIIGFIFLFVGMLLHFFTDTLAEWTVVAWYRVSLGKKLDHLSTLRVYFVAGVFLIIAGSVIGIMGLLPGRM
jgi:uncharacterized membrane protein